MSSLDRIQTGIIERSMLNVIYGPAGVGKTNFAAQFDNPLFLSFDRGDSMIDTNRIEPEDWNDALVILSDLYDSDHPYKTLNVDTVSFAEDMCRTQLAADNNVASLEEIPFTWKAMLFDEFQRLIDWCNALHSQGMNINYLGHSAVKKFKDPAGVDYDTYVLETKNRDLAQKLIRSVDNTFFLNFDHKGEERKQGMGKAIKASGLSRRFLYTENHPAYEAKNRLQLPERIELSSTPAEGYQRFITHVNNFNAAPEKPAKSTKQTKAEEK